MGRADINRPVLLALRDRKYGEFLQMLQFSFEGRPLKTRGKLIGSMVSVLEQALESSRFAQRQDVGTGKEKDFSRFLRLLLDSAQTVEVVLHHEELLKEDSSFLKRFLGANLGEISELETYLQIRGERVLKEIKLLASLAEGAYIELKRKNFYELDPDGQRRYQAMVAGDE